MVGYANLSNEVWVGAGASVTMIPETNIFLGATCTSSGAVLTLVGQPFELVTNLYTGCTVEMTEGVHTQRLVVKSNTHVAITFSEEISSDLASEATYANSGVLVNGAISASAGTTIAVDTVNATTKFSVGDTVFDDTDASVGVISAITATQITLAANNSVALADNENLKTRTFSNISATILPFGAPSPAIHSTASVPSKPSLLADNWLGLVNTFSPPNIDVEVAQMNLALAGTRNLQYQYKKGETVSGGSLDVSMSHGGWLYYVLGQISSVTSTVGADAVANSAAGKLLSTDDSTKFYRALGSTATAYPPTSTAITALDVLTNNPIHYTFTESNGQDLPSFALEVTYEKEGIVNGQYYVGSNDRLTAEESNGTNDDTLKSFETSHTEIYSRVFTGCQVNSTTISFDEGQEVKQTLDLVTRSAFDVPNGYVPKRLVREPKNLHNYTGDGTLALTSEDRRPYLFSEGSITLFGNTVARVKSGSITISNNITPQRFIGAYTRGITSAHIPAARTYEVSMNMLITDTDLWNDLRAEQGENLDAATKIKIKFSKSTDDFISITLQDFITQTLDIPFPEDKGPVEVAATFSARTLANCEYAGKWIILNND